MSTISNINTVNGVNNPHINKTPSFGENPQPVEENKTSTGKKVLIGTGAALGIAGAVVGGIMYAKHAKFNKAFNEIADSINKYVKNIKKDEFFTSRFDLSKMDEVAASDIAKIRELKSPKSLKLLKDLEQEYMLSSSLMRDSIQPYGLKSILEKSTTEEAKALQKLVDNKGDFQFVKKYYLEELANVQKRVYQTQSKATGKTAQETVDLFIKEGLLPQGVKPHTYDLTKELDLAVCNYTGSTGFTERMVRQGAVNDPRFGTIPKISERNTSFSNIGGRNADFFAPYNTSPQKVSSQTLANNVSKFKSGDVNVVSLELPSAGQVNGFDKSAHYYIGVGSRNGELTPLQKDIIDVGARLNDNERAAIAKLLHNTEDMDYDAILSIIQHYAKDTEFMARAAK